MKTNNLQRILITIIVLSIGTFTFGRDVIRTSKAFYSYEKNYTNLSPLYANGTKNIEKAKKIVIMNSTGVPDYSVAFNEAKEILANFIELDFPLKVRIEIGNPDMFVGDLGSESVLAMTIVQYVLNNFEKRNFYSSEWNSEGNDVFFPQALANRIYKGDTDIEYDDMTIYLNPEFADYWYIGEASSISEDQYDLTSIILRELITGCGFGSSLYKTGNTLSYMIDANGSSYPVLFDTKIKNSGNQWLANTQNSTTNLLNFLEDKQIYYKDNGKLWNDIEFSIINGVSNITKNTLSKTYKDNEDPSIPSSFDIMSINFGTGMAIRNVTSMTQNILYDLGWEKALITGSYREVGISSSTEILNPNTNYTFTAQTSGYNLNNSNFALTLIQQDGTYYELNTGQNDIFNVNYSNLPDYVWERDPDTGCIFGFVSFNGQTSNGLYLHGDKEIKLPLSPRNANISAVKSVNSSSMSAKINYKADGATNYIINYFAYGESAQYSIPINNKDEVCYVLDGLNPNKKYGISIQALNNYGNIYSETVTVGEDIVSQLSLVLTKVGSTLKYRFKLGTEYVTNLNISSVKILDIYGNLITTVNAGINETFSISSLTTGMYILSVDVENYTTYSKTFLK